MITISHTRLALLAVLCCMSMYGCKSPSGTQEPTDTELEKLKPELVVSSLGDNKYYLGFMVGAGGKAEDPRMIALRGIRRAEFKVFGADGSLLTTMSTEEIPLSGTQNAETKETSLTATGNVVWEGTAGLGAGGQVEMTLYGRNGVVKRIAPIKPEKAPPEGKWIDPTSSIYLTVDSRKTGSTTTEFIVTVKRVKPVPEGEYLPSGEKVRVEIQSGSGETVWSSSDGRMFTSAIGKVEPQQVGKEYQHRVVWDGKNYMTKEMLPTGAYLVVVTIPAKPKPYILREDFMWVLGK